MSIGIKGAWFHFGRTFRSLWRRRRFWPFSQWYWGFLVHGYLPLALKAPNDKKRALGYGGREGDFQVSLSFVRPRGQTWLREAAQAKPMFVRNFGKRRRRRRSSLSLARGTVKIINNWKKRNVPALGNPVWFVTCQISFKILILLQHHGQRREEQREVLQDCRLGFLRGLWWLVHFWQSQPQCGH